MLKGGLALIIMLHGAIHVMGFVSAFAPARFAFARPVSTAAGLAWLAAALLLVCAAVLLLMGHRFWWIAGAAGLLVSQPLIVLWWTDARFGTIANALVAVAVVVAGLGMRPGSNGSTFRSQVREGLARPAGKSVVTEADLAPLPAPVARYLRFVGVVGKGRVLNFRATFRGEIASARNAPLTPFHAEQQSFFDPPARLFFITSSRMGVPFDALHQYVGDHATMRVQLASVVTVVDARGPEMDRSETVTMFNDMCLLAPATLIDPKIRWKPIDEQTVEATFTNAGHTIGARLTFAPDGRLLNFLSHDRSQTSDGKTYARHPWSTPVRGYRMYGGLQLASGGEAIWHEPGGDFTYARMELVDLQRNVSPP
jgi:hypothetical protein